MTGTVLPNGDVLFPGVSIDDLVEAQPATIAESGVPLPGDFDYDDGSPAPLEEYDWSLTPEEIEQSFRMSELAELQVQPAL